MNMYQWSVKLTLGILFLIIGSQSHAQTCVGTSTPSLVSARCSETNFTHLSNKSSDFVTFAPAIANGASDLTLGLSLDSNLLYDGTIVTFDSNSNIFNHAFGGKVTLQLSAVRASASLNVYGDGTLSDGFDAAALYLKSKDELRIDNRMSLQFKKSGTGNYNNGLVGIYMADGSATKGVTLINQGDIGFASNVARANRGTKHRGIWLDHIGQAQARVNIVNHGKVNVRGDASSSHAIYLSLQDSVSDKGTKNDIVITNFGQLEASGDLIHVADSNWEAQIKIHQLSDNKQSGTMILSAGDDLLCVGAQIQSHTQPCYRRENYREASLTLNYINMRDGANSIINHGRLHFASGRQETSGTSISFVNDFGTGTGQGNKLYNHGTLILGSDSVKSHEMDFNSIKNVRLHSDSFLVMYLDKKPDGTRALFKGDVFEKHVFESIGSVGENTSVYVKNAYHSPIIELHMPSDLAIDNQDRLVHILMGNLSAQLDDGSNLTSSQLQDYLSNYGFRVFDSDGNRVTVNYEVYVNASSKRLEIKWKPVYIATAGMLYDAVSSPVTVMTSLDCSMLSSHSLSCAGGRAGNKNGLLGRTIDSRLLFWSASSKHRLRIDEQTVDGDFTFHITNLNGSINKGGVFNGIVIDTTSTLNRIQGRHLSSKVRGHVNVYHQSGPQQRQAKQKVFVRGGLTNVKAAAMTVSGDYGMTIHNGAPLVFDSDSEGNFAENLIGINAYNNVWRGGNTLIVNEARIGFDAREAIGAVARGKKKYGIYVYRRGGASNLGALTIEQKGVIDVRAQDESSHAIHVKSGAGSITVFNKGQMMSSGAIFYYGTQGDTADVTFYQESQHNLAGGFVSRGGDDIICIGAHNSAIMPTCQRDTANHQAFMTLLDVDMGAGIDRIDNHGVMSIGNAVTTSDEVVINNVEHIYLHEKSALELHLSYSNNAFDKIEIDSNIHLVADSHAPVLNIYLPSNFDIRAHGTMVAFDLLDAFAFTNNDGSMAQALNLMNSSLRVFKHGAQRTELRGHFAIKEKAGDDAIWTLEWSEAVIKTASSSLTCAHTAAGVMNCHGGTAGRQEGQLGAGVSAGQLFKAVADSSDFDIDQNGVSGDFVLRLDNLAGHINAHGEGHGIFKDGTADESRVSGDIYLHNQSGTSDGDKKIVYVRGAPRMYASSEQTTAPAMNAAGIYVKGSKSVILHNIGKVLFGSQSDILSEDALRDVENFVFNSALRAIHAEHGAGGTVTITNDDIIGFLTGTESGRTNARALFSQSFSQSFYQAFSQLRMVHRGSHHRGISVKRVGEGTTHIINNHTINVMASDNTSHALYVEGGTGDVNIANSGTLHASGDVIHMHSSAAGKVSFHNSGDVKGAAFTLSDGNDEINNRGSIHLNGMQDSDFGAGHDHFINHGRLILSADDDEAMSGTRLNGLEDFDAKSHSVLEIFMMLDASDAAHGSVMPYVFSDDADVSFEEGSIVILKMPRSYVLDEARVFPTFFTSSSVDDTDYANMDASLMMPIAGGAAYRPYEMLYDANALNGAGGFYLNAMTFTQLGDVNGDGASELTGASLAMARSLDEITGGLTSGVLAEDLFLIHYYVGTLLAEDVGNLGFYSNLLRQMSAPLYGDLMRSAFVAEQDMTSRLLFSACAPTPKASNSRAHYSVGASSCGMMSLGSDYVRGDNFNETVPVNLLLMQDIDMDDDVTLTMALGYRYSLHEGKSGGKGNGHRIHGGLTFHYAPMDNVRMSAGISAGGHLFDVERVVVQDKVTATPSIVYVGGHGALAYEMNMHHTVIEPYVALGAGQLRLEGVREVPTSETNGDISSLGVVVHEQSNTLANVTLGARVTHRVERDVSLDGALAMTYLITGDNIDMRGRFLTDENAGVVSMAHGSLGQFHLEYGLAVNWMIDRALELRVSYEGMASPDGDVSRHSGRLAIFY